MSDERYINRGIISNDHPMYRKMREGRGLNFVRQYTTPEFRFPTNEEMSELVSIAHLWKTGDRYWKLASRYYDDAELWWVIAWYNKKPTEGHVRVDDIIYIPTPIEKVLVFFD
tara:strand:- start:39 stop:377 length:339 start_codon:yes stop_codon:yes gene_type:complete